VGAGKAFDFGNVGVFGAGFAQAVEGVDGLVGAGELETAMSGRPRDSRAWAFSTVSLSMTAGVSAAGLPAALCASEICARLSRSAQEALGTNLFTALRPTVILASIP
jgi:hypothetical protein